TRMRVSMSDANQTACSNPFNYGEVEDYTVNITATARVDENAVAADTEMFETQIYPNPASNVAHIKLIGAKDNNQVQIYDMAGRNVYTATINGNEDHEINLASFEKGIYIINVSRADGVVERKKLVVQK
ncbi:MAG: T9SS type A sorting domain-containing protein, partial [Raineya sp.]